MAGGASRENLVCFGSWKLEENNSYYIMKIYKHAEEEERVLQSIMQKFSVSNSPVEVGRASVLGRLYSRTSPESLPFLSIGEVVDMLIFPFCTHVFSSLKFLPGVKGDSIRVEGRKESRDQSSYHNFEIQGWHLRGGSAGKNISCSS